jgi:hypothetical protein
MRLDLHVHHHYDDFRIRALFAELLRPILQREEAIMALTAKLKAAVDAANAGVAQANNELEAIAAALVGSPDVAAAAVAAALARVGVDEDAAADAINSARVSVQEHVDSVFQKVGVPQPIPVPPVPVGPDPLVFDASDLGAATVGQGYTGQVHASGGASPITYASSPPDDNGITFNSDGSFSGTPGEARDTFFSLTATDSSSPPLTANATVTISVAAAAVTEPEAAPTEAPAPTESASEEPAPAEAVAPEDPGAAAAADA